MGEAASLSRRDEPCLPNALERGAPCGAERAPTHNPPHHMLLMSALVHRPVFALQISSSGMVILVTTSGGGGECLPESLPAAGEPAGEPADAEFTAQTVPLQIGAERGRSPTPLQVLPLPVGVACSITTRNHIAIT